MNLVHLIAYLIAAALLLSGCAARPGQIALPDTPEVSESESEETEQPEVSEAPVTMPVRRRCSQLGACQRHCKRPPRQSL